MKRLGWLLIVPIFCALLHAQTPVPTGKVPGPKNETANLFYLGYARGFTDFGQRYGFNGFDGVASRYLSRRVALLAEFEFGRNGTYSATYYGYRAGGRYDFKAGGPWRPFGQFLVGGAHMKGLVGTPEILQERSFTGFSWAGGGGLDMSVTPRWGTRVQFNHVRVPFGTHGEERADWNRLSGGLTYRW